MAASRARKAVRSPARQGHARLISTGDTARRPSCGHAVRLRLDGRIIAHKNEPGHCPGSGEQPVGDAPLACWLPVKDGLTPHGLRHDHKTWSSEDGIPEILAERRLGHQVPGMRGLYTHASQQMRQDLTAALQDRWEKSLRQRASRPALPGPAARQLAGAVPGRTTRPPRSSTTIGVLEEQRRVLSSHSRRLHYPAGCVLRSHTWHLLPKDGRSRGSGGICIRPVALRPAESRLLTECDSTRTVTSGAGGSGAQVLRALLG